MSRQMMRVTLVVECPADLAKYPESSTPAERAEIDRQNYEQDPHLILKLLEGQEASKKVRVTAVVIE